MNTKTKKNIGILVLTVAVIFAIVKGGTSLAYFFANQEHNSDYQLSKIQTEIVEEVQKTEANVYKKNPRIKNIGISDCIVRAKVIITPSSLEQSLTLNGLENNPQWVYNQDDKYYYYQGILEPNQETNSIFDSVTIANVENIPDFDIIVYNEAIQVNAYNDEGQELSVLDGTGVYNQQSALQLWQYYK